MEERFLYEIRPVRPIIINGRRTRRACSLNLTKDEVKEYLASANVYRRFGGTDVVKVTGANLDQLHVSKEARGNINPDAGKTNLGDKAPDNNQEGARGNINPDAGKTNLGDKAPDNNQEGITGDTTGDKVDNIEKSVETDNSDSDNVEDTDEVPSIDETTEDSNADTTGDDVADDSDNMTEESEEPDTEETDSESAEEDQIVSEKIDTVEDDNGSIAEDTNNESTEEAEEETAEPVKASNIQERAKVIRPNYQQYNGNRKKKKNHR